MEEDINKLLEKTKLQAFLYKDAALLGTLMTKLKFSWNKDIETARVNPSEIQWNPEWFAALSKNDRVFVLLHELWHLARLHSLRLGTRDPKIFNMACDIRINNDLFYDKYHIESECFSDTSLDYPNRLTEEEIYDILYQEDSNPDNYPDIEDIGYYKDNSSEEQELLQMVQQATMYSASCGKESVNNIEKILAEKLKPKVPWERLLRQYFLDIAKEDYTWKKPNRRYPDVYLPSLNSSEGLLTALNYYIDTSGSISSSTLIRVNAELRNIWQDLHPELLRVINFDTEIRSVQEIHQGTKYSYCEFTGRGGTELSPVFEHIKKTKPVAAIIFSDLYCNFPKEKLNTPIIWIVIDSNITPPFGKTVHLPKEILDGRKR